MRSFLRGVVELHILHHAAEAEVHGAWMSVELARHGYRISPGTLYPTLHRLHQDGLLACRDEVRDGRRIRLYRITAAGQDTLDEMRHALRELAYEFLPELSPRYGRNASPGRQRPADRSHSGPSAAGRA